MPTPVGKWGGYEVFAFSWPIVLSFIIFRTLLEFLRIWGPNFKKTYATVRGRGPLTNALHYIYYLTYKKIKILSSFIFKK